MAKQTSPFDNRFIRKFDLMIMDNSFTFAKIFLHIMGINETSPHLCINYKKSLLLTTNKCQRYSYTKYYIYVF
jgi:hypothetical protein